MSKYLYAALLVFILASMVCAQRPQPGATPTPKPAVADAPKAADDCSCEDKPLPRVLAIVNGLEITAADFPGLAQKVKELQQPIIEARKHELDLQINTQLLEAEAKKRGITRTRLLEDEVVSKTTNPTPAEVETYYIQNKAKIEAQAERGAAFAELKDQIVDYLRNQQQRERAKVFADSLRSTAGVKILLKEATPSSSTAERARLMAIVNGKKITAGDVDDALRPLVSQVQEDVYERRKHEVDLSINDTLLRQEAQKRQLSPIALLDAEVNAKVPVITEAQALDFYNKNKERITGEFAPVKEAIISYLREIETRKSEQGFVDRLRSAATIQMFITPPTAPVFQIAVDDQPVRGNPGAAVTIVEFTDYQCEACGATYPVLERLMSEYSDRVRLVVRDYPLAQHANARKAAEAAEAAREQGKYWEFIAILFHNQSSLEVAKLKEYATAIGLDRAKFDTALDGGRFATQVERDMVDGDKIGVPATPSIFINGRRVKGLSYDLLRAAIEAALKPSSTAGQD